MAKRKTFDEILQERYGSSEDESTGVNDRSYDDIMLERRLSGKESDKWTSDMTKAFNQGNRYSKQAYEGAVEIAKNSRRVKTGAERYGLFSGGNEELNKGILHKASNYIKSKIDDGKSEITEEESLKHASNVLAGVSEDNQALLKKYVDAQDSSKSTPFMYLMNTDSPVMQKQQMKDSETMDAVKKQFMENTGVDEKTFNKMVANYGYTYHADENEKQKKKLQQSSGATKALASAVDVLASPVTGFVALAGTGKNQVDPELGRDKHTVYSSLKDFSENTEEAVLNDAEKIDNKALRTAAKGAYEIGMATGKSAMSMMTGSEAASALGLTGKSARAVANLVSLPQFGASSYVSTLEEAQERGLDTKDAYRTALVAGGAEMATEVISLEGIWDILESKGKVAAKTAIGNVLKQSFFEGSEEVANDLINEIADGLINGDKSKYVQSVRYYMSDQYAKENGLDAPLSEDEAKKKANIDFAKSTAIDGFLGAASGGLMGGAATAINAYANTKGGQYLSGNEQIRDDIVLNKDSENYISDDRADYDSEEDYQKAQSAIEQLIDDSGEKISGKEARSLYQNVAEAIGSQNSNRAEARVQREVETIESAQTPDELVRATESVKNDVPEVQQAIDNTKARMVAQGATQADFDNVVTPTRAYEMAKRGQVSESDLASMSTDARRAAEAGISESVSADIKNVTKFDASTVLVKENGKAKQTNITGEVTKSGDQYYLTTKKGAKVELSEDILSGTTKANGDNTKGKLLMYGNSHAAGIISLEDPELMTIALQTKINQPSVPSTSIVKAVKTFNTLGRSGVSFESIVNDKKQKFMVDAIGEKVLRQAYDLGAKEGALDEEKMANPTTKKGNGKVSFASREAGGAYEKLDHANKTFLDKFAEKTGVDFEIFTDDADAEGTVRGQYVPEEGKIRLNVAEDTDILEVAMHEGIGEFLKAHNAKGYAEITETILDYYAENNADALAKRIEDYKRAYSDEEGKSTRGSADELVNDVLAEIFSDDAGIEKLGTWLFDNGKEKEAKTIKDVLIDFINQMKSWIADIKAQGGLSAAERSKLSMTEKDMDALQNRILKAMDEAIANRDSRAEGETAEQSIRNSVKVDANGKQYVEIDEDIIKGITGSKNIKSAVRAYIKENYPSIDMMGFKLGVNAKSRNEFVNSKTSQYMQNKLKRFFIDKMRMAGNLEEIVNVGDGYTWEDIKHSRKDKLIGFVRGNVQIRVGSNDYIADIVLADDKTKGLIFYDIVNMKSTAIKEAPTERTHENHAAQVAGASTDSISQNEKNATRKSVKVDSDGRKLSEGQQEYFKNTKVLDDNGNLMVVYHGSPSKFNVFDAERIGTRASAEGYGFYFTDSREKAEGYHEKDGNLMKGYLDIQKPLSLDEVTIKRSEVKKLLENIDPTGDDVLSNYDASGVGYPSRAWYNNAMRDALDMIMENENDADIIAEIANNYGSMDVVSEVRKVLGYDGYMAPDKYENGKVYVAFERNQFKNIDNESPTSNEDVRYSRKVDDQGNKLTEEQQEYFKESKVRNEDGNLLVMYHGTPNNDFYIFDAKKSKGTNLYGRGFYFAYDNSTSSYYDGENGRILECYLNITNPVDVNAGRTISDTELHDMVSAVADEYGIEDYGYYAAVDSVTEDLAKKESDFAILQDLNATCVGDFTEMLKFLNDEVGTSYDGIIARDQVVAFYPNQIKKIDNRNPTENADIRYSRKVEDARKSIKEYGIVSPYHDTLNEANVVSAIMGRMNEALDGVSVDLNGVMDVTKSIIKKYDANISTNDLAGAIWQTFNYMNNNQMETDYQGMMDYLLNIGDEVITTSQLKDADQQAVYDEVRKQLRTHAIHLTKADRAELVHRYGSWNEAFGAIQQAGIKLDNNGIRIDSAYGDIRNEIMKISGVQMSEETTAADQIASIIDTVSSLEPEVSTFEGANDLDKSLMVASDIIDEYYTRAVKEMSNNIVESTDTGKKAVKEAVDKQTEKLRKEMQQYKKTIRASYQDQVTRYKTELERTQKDLRAVQNNLKNWKPIPETQILNQEELDAKAEQMATKALTDYKMAQERSKQIDNIKRTGHRMIRWLDAPTDKQHVPEFLQRPLSEFLSSVDFLPLRAKETSKNTLDWRHQMMVLKDVIARMKESDPEIDSDGYALSQVLVVDELVEKMQNILDNNQDVNMKVSKLPAGDLKEMSEVLSSLSAAINHMNTTYANSRYDGIGDLARASIREMQERKPTKTERTKAGNAAFNFFNLDEIEPLTFFEGLGSASASVYEELRHGFDIRTNHIRETADFFEKKKKELGISDKEMAEWGKEKHEFHFPGGDITMTTPQIMSLLETVNRKQGKPHVEAGGIKIADTEVKVGKVKKIVHMTKAVHIDEAQYDTIISELTPKQRAMANELQHYMATECADWGNRVSREMYGYKKFTEKDYFPLRTDSTTRETKPSDDQAPSYYTIKNRSFTKQITPHAANAVVIDDIFDVFTRHVVQMAEYDGYTMPIADAMRWYNYQEKEINTIRNQDLLGEIAGDTTNARNEIKNSVKQNMDRVLGKNAGAYFQQFIKDINGDYAGTGGTPDLSTYLMSSFKAQAVGANIRVIVQQPTAIVRAADRIEAKYLLQAQTSLPKAVEYAKKSQDNSAISYWKAQGYYETLIGKSLKQIITGEGTVKEKITDAMGKGAGIADDLTWGVMYRAAELKVKDQKPNLKYDSEEFTKKTVEIFEDIIDHTQVVDTIFHKSQWMRNQGLGYRATSAFMAEPTKTYNMFYRAYQDCLRSGNKKEMVDHAGRTAMIFLVEQALNAAVTGFIDAWRDDDKDEGIIGFLQSEADHTKENFFGNLYVWNLFPVIKEVQNFIDGYDATEYTTEGLATAVDTISELYKVVIGQSNKTFYGVSYLIAQGISQLSGIPISSALREVKSLYNTLNGIWGGTDWYKSKTTQQSAEKRKRQTNLNNAIQKKDLEDSKNAMNEIYQNAYDNGIANGKSENEAESDAWSSVRSALKKSYQEQEDRSTATINRYVTLMRKTKKKVSGKNEFKAVTEKDARDTVKGW